MKTCLTFMQSTRYEGVCFSPQPGLLCHLNQNSLGPLSLSPSALAPPNYPVTIWSLGDSWWISKSKNSVRMPLECMTVSVGICMPTIYCCRHGLRGLTAEGGNSNTVHNSGRQHISCSPGVLLHLPLPPSLRHHQALTPWLCARLEATFSGCLSA